MNEAANNPTEMTMAAARFARAGGEVLMRYFRTEMRVEEKAAGDLVSEADLEAEKQIVALIRESFPAHKLLTEEAGASEHTSEHLWVIDPLDGTNNFANGLAHFATSVAYYHAGVAQSAAIYDPIRDELYCATREAGAFRNQQPLSVSEADTLSQGLVGTGFYYDRGEMMRRTLRTIEACFGQQIQGMRRCGAATLDLCNVAAGTFGAFFEFYLSPWDFAAARLIVEEAGGKITTCEGDAVELAGTSILATNDKLHQAMLQLIADNQ